MTRQPEPRDPRDHLPRTLTAIVAGWAVPGLGHVLLGRVRRGLLFGFLLFAVRERLPSLRWLDGAARAALAAAAMGAVVWALPEWHVLVRVLVGVAVGLPLARLTGAWQSGDLARLRGI